MHLLLLLLVFVWGTYGIGAAFWAGRAMLRALIWHESSDPRKLNQVTPLLIESISMAVVSITVMVSSGRDYEIGGWALLVGAGGWRGPGSARARVLAVLGLFLMIAIRTGLRRRYLSDNAIENSRDQIEMAAHSKLEDRRASRQKHVTGRELQVRHASANIELDRFCPSCGAPRSSANVRCEYCGSRLRDEDADVTVAAVIARLCLYDLGGNHRLDADTAEDTIERLKTFTWNGEFEQGLEIVKHISSWHRELTNALDGDRPTSFTAMLEAAEVTVQRCMRDLAHSAGNDERKRKRLLRVAMRWHNHLDIKGRLENPSRNIWGRTKDRSALEARIRAELGLR